MTTRHSHDTATTFHGKRRGRHPRPVLGTGTPIPPRLNGGRCGQLLPLFRCGGRCPRGCGCRRRGGCFWGCGSGIEGQIRIGGFQFAGVTRRHIGDGRGIGIERNRSVSRMAANQIGGAMIGRHDRDRVTNRTMELQTGLCDPHPAGTVDGVSSSGQ